MFKEKDYSLFLLYLVLLVCINNQPKVCFKELISDNSVAILSWNWSKSGNNFLIIRNSRPEVFCKKGVLRNFAKFTGKHLCQNLFFNKVACLSCEFCEIFLKTPFVTEHFRWLLLDYEWLSSISRNLFMLQNNLRKPKVSM